MNRYDNILTAERGAAQLRVGVITLNRPKQLNALNDALMDDLGAALTRYDADDAIGCIVITGNERAFAAGADIAAMAKMDLISEKPQQPAARARTTAGRAPER